VSPPLQLIYLPYIGMGKVNELRFGPVVLWNARGIPTVVTNQKLRDRLQPLLAMNRAPAGTKQQPKPIEGIGLVSVGARDFRMLTTSEQAAVRDFRCALFLSSLARNVRDSGPNSGWTVRTAENFGLVFQTFAMDSESFSEQTGVIVRMSNMGLKISESVFLKPSYVNIPRGLTYDERLFQQLIWLRANDRRLLKRILRAAAVFMESYYNTPSLDVNARILMQTTAFEILLDLPETEQRRHFKDLVEALCAAPGERKYSYTYEVRTTRRRETRTRKGIWADRFYTLRNHIIHGKRVAQVEWTFRGVQHHLVVSPLFFVFVAKQLIDRSRSAKGLPADAIERLDWHKAVAGDEDGDNEAGFRLSVDWAKAIHLDPVLRSALLGDTEAPRPSKRPRARSRE